MPLKLRYEPNALRDTYLSADPFPHVALDGLFDDADLEPVLADFPRPEETRWLESTRRRRRSSASGGPMI